MDARERLEVEDEDKREKRLGQLLSRVDQAGDNTPNAGGPSTAPLINPMAPGSVPAPVEPPIELLDRVRQFLPQLAESNASLPGRDQHELDIENITDGDSYYIEMNLGLGVFEGTRPDEGLPASHSSSSSSVSEHDSEDSEDSDTGSEDSPSCSEDGVQVAARPKIPLPRRAIPSITVLSESGNPPGGSSA